MCRPILVMKVETCFTDLLAPQQAPWTPLRHEGRSGTANDDPSSSRPMSPPAFKKRAVPRIWPFLLSLFTSHTHCLYQVRLWGFSFISFFFFFFLLS
ncbi:hypothetical protein F5X97DRAFT_304971 [Nemania serpens]|nr:hypothetical protein F5X97DRAFT_304971 [Nemania serpens]